ncbi:MAG: FAD-binding oxidoreductase, partial [Proteobacteria bacterium]|nr:FAD-binding oxidoreductase [Pseudomonadota bacterium]
MATADVTVIGGGIFGLSVAFACAARGARVRLVERQRIGAGCSGGLVGALAPHVPDNWNSKKEFQLDSLLMAEAFWARAAHLSGTDPGYARLGRLQPLADAAAVAQAERRADGAARLWRGRAVWQVVAGADDWRGASPTGLWAFDDLSARLNPRRALAS